MARVQEGAFDPGEPPPPRPEDTNPPDYPAEGVFEGKQESFREKALRRAREAEEAAKGQGGPDWLNTLADDADPGDEAMLDALTIGRGVSIIGMDLSPSSADAMAMATVNPPIHLIGVSAEPTTHGWKLRVDFARRGSRHSATELVRAGRSPTETIYRLRALADRIERELSPMEPILSRDRSLKW